MSTLSNVPESTHANKISQSEMYSLLRCKAQYNYAYIQGLEPKTTPDYLTKGSFLHELMANYLTRLKSGHAKTLEEISLDMQREAIRDSKPTIDEPTRLELLTQLNSYWKDVGTDGFDVVAVEQEFYVDLGFKDTKGKIAPVHGFIDAVIYLPSTEETWIVEHKTAGRAWSAQQFMFSYQAKLYAMAWEELTGIRPMGMQYNFFYPKRYEIRTQHVTDTEIDALRKELNDVVRMRSILNTYQVYPREPLWGCNGCQYRDLCYAELVGGDTKHMREELFVVNQDKVDRFGEE